MVSLGKEYIEVGRLNEALKRFNQASMGAPQWAEPKHWAGYANYLLKNYEGSILLYQEALKIDGGNPLLYKRLGLSYVAMNRPQDAKRAIQKYLEMEPDAQDKAEFERFL